MSGEVAEADVTNHLSSMKHDHTHWTGHYISNLTIRQIVSLTCVRAEPGYSLLLIVLLCFVKYLLPLRGEAAGIKNEKERTYYLQVT